MTALYTFRFEARLCPRNRPGDVGDGFHLIEVDADEYANVANTLEFYRKSGDGNRYLVRAFKTDAWRGDISVAAFGVDLAVVRGLGIAGERKAGK